MFGKKNQKIPQPKKEELFNRVRPIVARQLEVAENKVILSAKVAEDLGADSLDATELVMALEEEFNIEILDEDVEKIKTIEDIIKYLADKIK